MKRDSKGYFLKTFTFKGKRIYVRAKTRKELFEKVVERKNQLEQQSERVYNPTLRQYYEYFTNRRRREIKESTLRSQKSQMKLVLDYKDPRGALFGDRKLKDITRRDIERIRDALYDQGRTAPTLNIIFSHLGSVFKSACTDETIDKNPCKALKPLKRDIPLVGETKHRALTPDETKRFFIAAKERDSYYYNGYLFLIKSGLRIGELSALSRGDIDLDKGFIHITKTAQRTENGGYTIGDSTKTKSGSRDIPLTGELIDIIKTQEDYNRSEFGELDGGLIFTNKEGKMIREQSVNREIKRLCLMADVAPFTCHAFRNTFATRWIEQRPNSYKVLSEILGHKDISITLNLYTHVMQEQKINEMQMINISVM